MNLDLEGLTLPLRLRPAAPLSDLELQRFSSENKPYRIERNPQGELVIMTPVGGIGGTHEVYVSRMLANWAEEQEGGLTFGPNTGFNLADGSCYAPDAAWLARAAWDGLNYEQQSSFPPVCPSFIVEIRSRSDFRKMLEAKMSTWLENGAQLAWLIDPIDATVTIYRPGEAIETLERPDVVLGHAPVEGFQLKTTRLWPKV